MYQYKIEKAGAIKAPSSKALYPFKDMEIGDSILIKDRPMINISSARTNFCMRNPDYKFTMRTLNEGVRVWRVAKD